MINRFFSGFNFVFRGSRVLSEVPGIKGWLILPFLIQIVLLAAGLYFGIAEIKILTLKLISFFLSDASSTWGSAIYYIFLVLFGLVFSVIYFYFIYLLAMVVASPFYSIITEKILVHFKVIKPRESWSESVRVAIKMISVSAIRGLILALIGIGLFICSFVPMVNFVAAFIAFLIIALDVADFAFEALEWNIAKRWRFFKDHFIEFSGMATFVGLTALLPGLILFVMPFAVLGATDFVAKEMLKTLKPIA